MKTEFTKLILGCAFAVLMSAVCHAGYHTEFQTPSPYTLNSTVIGSDGWESVSEGSRATVVKAPWDLEGDTTALRLYRETGDSAIRLKNGDFEAIEGFAKVSVGMAFDDFSGNKGKTTFAFHDLSQSQSPIVFGFDNADGGGLYYRGINTSEQVVILPKAQVQLNSVYTFTLSINVSEKTFNILVTGFDEEGAEFSYAKANITSGNFGQSKLRLVYVETSSVATYKSYVSFIDVRAIPEPGSVALLFGGGVIACSFGLARRRRARLL